MVSRGDVGSASKEVLMIILYVVCCWGVGGGHGRPWTKDDLLWHSASFHIPRGSGI